MLADKKRNLSGDCELHCTRERSKRSTKLTRATDAVYINCKYLSCEQATELREVEKLPAISGLVRNRTSLPRASFGDSFVQKHDDAARLRLPRPMPAVRDADAIENPPQSFE